MGFNKQKRENMNFNQIHIPNSLRQAIRRQVNINNAKNMLNSPEGAQFKQECQKGLQSRDFDGDGKTSAKEMGADFNRSTATIFKNANRGYQAVASALSQRAGSIFSQYAGGDGILDEYEYSAALNSDEYDAMITKYNELQNSVSGEYEVEDDIGLQNDN